MSHEVNLHFLYNNYDVFLIDVYGVLYNGHSFFEGALDLLEKMKAEGKNVIILSNTTMVFEDCVKKYAPKGLNEKLHYDLFISSGEAFRKTLNIHLGNAKTYFSAFSKNDELFKNTNLKKVYSVEDADFIYVGSPNRGDRIYLADNLRDRFGNIIPIENITSIDCHDISGFEEINYVLDKCLLFQKTLVVVNPDLFAIEHVSVNNFSEKRPILCQGTIGEFYEKMGGKVIYFGKPYPAIYDFAKRFIPNGENSKIAMIGDTLWTDILGGNMAGVETILTLTGVSGTFLKSGRGNLSIDQKIERLLREIASKMTHKSLKGYSQVPNHVIDSFA